MTSEPCGVRRCSGFLGLAQKDLLTGRFWTILDENGANMSRDKNFEIMKNIEIMIFFFGGSNFGMRTVDGML